MAIKKRTDLIIGNEYYIAVTKYKDSVIKVTLESIAFPSWAFPEMAEVSVTHPEFMYMCYYLWEIGIGETAKEAVDNFQKLK